eukprot:481732-Amphidinium_carterae.1
MKHPRNGIPRDMSQQFDMHDGRFLSNNLSSPFRPIVDVAIVRLSYMANVTQPGMTDPAAQTDSTAPEHLVEPMQPSTGILADLPESTAAVQPSAATDTQTHPPLQDDDLPDFDAADRLEEEQTPGAEQGHVDTTLDDAPAEAAAETEQPHQTEVLAPQVPTETSAAQEDSSSTAQRLEPPGEPQQYRPNPLPNLLGGDAVLIGGPLLHFHENLPEQDLPEEAQQQLQELHNQVAAIRSAHLEG